MPAGVEPSEDESGLEHGSGSEDEEVMEDQDPVGPFGKFRLHARSVVHSSRAQATQPSSGGKATISGKKRADICIFVKEASAVESVGQGTAAGTSRASGKAPKKTCPEPGCGFRVPNRQMGRCPGPGCTHEWVPKAKQP